MREIFLPLPGRGLSYRLVIEPGLRHRLGSLLSPFGFPPQVVVISDRRVARLHGAVVLDSLKPAGIRPGAPDHASRRAGQGLGRGPAPGPRTPGPGRTPVHPDHRPGWRRGGGLPRAFWPPSSCGGCPSSRCPPPCWPWWTRPSAARPPSICPKGKTSWAPFTSPGWWSSTPNFCAPCPGPSGSTAWPKCSRPGLSGTGTC